MGIFLRNFLGNKINNNDDDKLSSTLFIYFSQRLIELTEAKQKKIKCKKIFTGNFSLFFSQKKMFIHFVLRVGVYHHEKKFIIIKPGIQFGFITEKPS